MGFVIELNRNRRSASEVADIMASPGFGRHFSDHMIMAEWSSEKGWREPTLQPYGPLVLDPATQVLHYGQTIFEGFKAFAQPNGGIATFRPGDNAKRFNRSAERLALPSFPEDLFVEAADLLIRTDAHWVPTAPGTSLYMRPLMMATEVGLGVHPASEVTFLLLASPAGSYFSGTTDMVSIWLTDQYTRAAPGGTGAAKAGGNYAASLVAQQEAIAHDCQQVLFLDAVEHRWIEEFGGMNFWMVVGGRTLITPELSGSLLEGVTRDSICTVAADLGYDVDVRRIAIDELRSGIESGAVTEVFACGTAAVITSVGRLGWADGVVTLPGEAPVAGRLRTALVDIQRGLAADRYGWMHHVK